MKTSIRIMLSAAVCAVVPATALAHGFAGKRFFPATLATDDPFVADELSLPTIGRQRFGATDLGEHFDRGGTHVRLGLRVDASRQHRRRLVG